MGVVRPCPPVHNDIVTPCHLLFLDPSLFYLPLSFCQTVYLSLCFAFSLFFVNLCVSCTDMVVIYHAQYLFARDIAHQAYFLTTI